MKERVRRVLNGLAWVCVVLMLLLVVAWTIQNVRGSAQFESELHELKRNGYALSLPAMAPARPEPGENAAPFYTAAFALCAEPGEGEGAWDHDPMRRVAELPPEDRALLKAWLARNQEAFDMLLRARKRPKCRFEHDYTQGFSMLLPELSEMLKISRALQARAELQALEGDAAGARDSVRSIFDVGRSVREEPILVVQLVRMVVNNRGIDAIGACVTSASTAEDLKEWRALVPDPKDYDRALELSLRGDMAVAADLLSRPAEEFFALTGDKNNAGLLGLVLAPFVKADGARYLQSMRKAVEASRADYATARAGMPDPGALSGRHWAHPVRSLLLPALGRSVESVTAARAWIAVARAGLDAELEQRTSGRYPETLTATDPFTGRPLNHDHATGKISSAGRPDGSDTIEWILRPAKK